MRKNNKLCIGLVCPTYNAGELWKDWINAYNGQSIKADTVLIVDSSSNDQTVQTAELNGFKVIKIDKESFNHGGTRNRAVTWLSNNLDFLIFLTQDAILNSNSSIEKILEPFKDPSIAAICGRQLPHKNADPISQHSRLYNYGKKSTENSKKNISKKGLKTAYMSNSFAAYRYNDFIECGGFPEDLIFGEDMYLAAKMILRGRKTYYAANATALHSHNYSILEEFKRYFDIGVFHKNQPFLLENFGKPSGEGMKYAFSEFKYCLKRNIFWAFRSAIGTIFKFMGYKFGYNYNEIPNSIRKYLSMNSYYWI